jgi:hypothetical protein
MRIATVISCFLGVVYLILDSSFRSVLINICSLTTFAILTASITRPTYDMLLRDIMHDIYSRPSMQEWRCHNISNWKIDMKDFIFFKSAIVTRSDNSKIMYIGLFQQWWSME